MLFSELKEFLDEKVTLYNNPKFIDNDPISVPHQYVKKQDIEITAFFASVFAWGQRKTIINKCQQLFSLMDNAPYDFIMEYKKSDVDKFKNFKHRTFNFDDLRYFLDWLQFFYKKNNSLENAFVTQKLETQHTELALINFYHHFFERPHLPRTQKHIQSPEKHSACKRLNMFLRWMVRKDKKGVDFGIWEKISPSQLLCPCDVHVHRIALKLGLIDRKQADWQTTLQLTEKLRQMDSNDPIKYDFALFGLGIIEKF